MKLNFGSYRTGKSRWVLWVLGLLLPMAILSALAKHPHPPGHPPHPGPIPGPTNAPPTPGPTNAPPTPGPTNAPPTPTPTNAPPTNPPTAAIDFSHWSLTLPDAAASTVTTEQLLAGYSDQYFYKDASDGSQVFWCPSTGGTTPNSHYPRCELREMLDPNNVAVNWSLQGTHTMNARCRVMQVSSSQRVAIGQIHGYLNGPPALAVLVWDSGTVQLKIKPISTSPDFENYTLTSVALGELIQYQMSVQDGVVSVLVNGATKTMNVLQTDPMWGENSFYFKAGSYCFDLNKIPGEGSLVKFYQLEVHHQ